MQLYNITRVAARAADGSGSWYQDACGTTHALELIGERWSLVILREMMFGPRRFGDLRASLPGLSANILSQRLETLKGHGLVVKSKLPPPASVQVYGLTEWGFEADQLLMVLGTWAARSPGHDPSLPLSKASLMLSFRTMFRPESAGDAAMVVGFRLGEESFRVLIMDGVLTAERSCAKHADIVFTATPEAMAGFIYGEGTLDALEATGAIAIEGDRERANRFKTFFHLPPKAEKPT